jgi:hypothetical protein
MARMNRIHVENESVLQGYPNRRREKLTNLTEVLKDLTDKRFTGYIKINYTQGNIARVEKFEEILKK